MQSKNFFFPLIAMLILMGSVFAAAPPPASPTATSLTPSNSIIDSGQYVTYNVLVASANVPFTANLVLVSNSTPISIVGGLSSSTVAQGSVFNTIVSSTNGIITFNSLSITTTSSTGGAVAFNVIVTDNTPTTFNSISNTITLNPALATASAPTAVSKVDAGQTAASDTLPSSIGGSGTVTYYWYYSLNGGTYTLATTAQCATPSGTATNGEAISCVTPTSITSGSYTFEIEMTDSASTAVTTTSTASGTATVSPALAAPTITSPLSANILDVGQSLTVSSSTASGGTGSYSYAWSVASGTCPGFSSATGTSFTYAPTSTTSTCEFKVTATDTGTSSPDTATSSPTPSITVKSTPSVISITPSATRITPGQSVTYNGEITGGTGPFTVNLVLEGTTVNALTGVSAGSIFTFATIIPPAGLDTYNVIATDDGTSIPFIFNSTSSTINVNPASGGAALPTYDYIDLSDNINSTSSASVFDVYITSQSSKSTSYIPVLQSQLPYSLKFLSGSIVNVSFACSLNSGGINYTFSGDVGNLGLYTACNQNYTFFAGRSLNSTYFASEAQNATSVQQNHIHGARNISIHAQSALISGINVSKSSPESVNFTADDALINITTNLTSQVRLNLSVSNVLNKSLAAPSDYSKLDALNISVNNSETYISVSLKYLCGINSSILAPFILKNDTWYKISNFSIDTASCTVSFAIPNDPIVSLMEQHVNTTITPTSIVPKTSPTTTLNTTPITNATPYSTSAAYYTTIAAKNISTTQAYNSASGSTGIEIIAIIVIIVLIVVAYYFSKRNAHSLRRK